MTQGGQITEFIKKNKVPIIIIVILIVIVVLYNKHGYKIKRLFMDTAFNPAPQQLSDVRKFQIQEHMKKIKNDIDDVSYSEWYGGGHDSALYETLLGWYDDEIIYAADYYQNFLAQGTSFYSDLDGEYFFWSDVNNRVLDKLSELGKT